MRHKRIRSEVWNAAVSELNRARLHSGAGILVGGTERGQVVSLVAQNDGMPVHPWKVDAKWNGENYVLSVRAGFVNGRPAKVAVPVGNPGAGKEEIKLVDLTDLPEISVPAALWTDGTTMPVRQFFLDLGVQQRQSEQAQIDAALAGSSQAGQEPGLELLRCDVVLSVQKLLVAGELTGIGDEVQYSYSVEGNSVDVRMNTGRVHVVSRWSAQTQTEVDLTAQAQEPMFDEVKLATVYLVKENQDLDINGRELVYVEQSVFWNLGYAPFTTLLNYQGTTITPNLNLSGALAALGEIQRLQTLLAQPFGVQPPSNKGYFWTQ